MKNPILIGILPVVACFALLPGAQGQLTTPPDGCYPNFTTAEGCNALLSLTTGSGNTGLGWFALFSDSTGSFNTAVGGGALDLNNGDSNTAVGAAALLLNTTGIQNTAVGTDAQVFNDSGSFNTALGFEAMQSAAGSSVVFNTAVGFQALMNATANANVAVGDEALMNLSSGEFNTAIGAAAGSNNTNGSNNIYIGQGSQGVAGESHTCYIQEIAGASIPTANAAFVLVDTTTGQLATVLVNADGNRMTVPISQSQLQAAPQGRYEAVPQRSHEDGRQAMLDELLKQQEKIAELEGTVARLAATVEEQAAQIQKVSAQLELNKSAPQVVANKP
jgi:hypothetical protein